MNDNMEKTANKVNNKSPLAGNQLTVETNSGCTKYNKHPQNDKAEGILNCIKSRNTAHAIKEKRTMLEKCIVTGFIPFDSLISIRYDRLCNGR
jgi:hypothetical protein